MKKTIAMLLTLAMVMGLSVTAFAAADGTSTSTGRGTSATGAESEAQVPLVGEITKDVVLISVVVPTQVPFTITTKTGTGCAAAGDAATPDSVIYNGVIIPTEAKITNNSTAPVTVDIVGVADPDGLLDKVNLALWKSGASDATALANPLSTTVDPTTNKINLVTGLANAGTALTLKIYASGKTVKDDANADQALILNEGTFTVTTSLKISIPAVPAT